MTFSIEQLKSTAKLYYERILRLEDQKYDLEVLVKRKDIEVSPIRILLHVHYICYILYMHVLTYCIPFEQPSVGKNSNNRRS